MRIVVADAGPLNYLVLTGDIAVLESLFTTIVVPNTVRRELLAQDSPDVVRHWAESPPGWIQIRDDAEERISGRAAKIVSSLDSGERAAIALAIGLKADLVLMDDRDGVAAARQLGLRVTGTLGVLDLAARAGLVDLYQAFERLKSTSFYYRQSLLDEMLAKQEKGQS